jgi:hypothetical protein
VDAGVQIAKVLLEILPVVQPVTPSTPVAAFGFDAR